MSILNADLKEFMISKGLTLEATKMPIPNLRHSWNDADGNLVIPKRDVVQDMNSDNIFNTGVKKNYQVLQYADSFSKLYEIAKVTDLTLIEGGLWNDGGEAFIQFELPGFMSVGNGGDRVARRLTAISSHSSVYSFIILITPFRFWCANQIPHSFAQVKKEQRENKRTMVKIKHTIGGLQLINDIPKWLELVDGQFKTIEDKYNVLNNIKIKDPAMITEAFARVFQPKEGSDKSSNMTKTQVEAAIKRCMDADGGKVERNSAWNLANAIQGAFQHEPMKRSKNPIKSMLVGSIATRSQEAFSTVMEVCSNPSTDPSKYKVDADIASMLSGITI